MMILPGVIWLLINRLIEIETGGGWGVGREGDDRVILTC